MSWGRLFTSALGPALALVGCVGCEVASESTKEIAEKQAKAWADRNLLQEPVIECRQSHCTVSHGEVGTRRVEYVHCNWQGCYR